MPPKRKAAASSKARGKKIKEEQEAPKDAFQTAKEALKSAAPLEKSQRNVDSHCDLPAEVSVLLLCVGSTLVSSFVLDRRHLHGDGDI